MAKTAGVPIAICNGSTSAAWDKFVWWVGGITEGNVGGMQCGSVGAFTVHERDSTRAVVVEVARNSHRKVSAEPQKPKPRSSNPHP